MPLATRLTDQLQLEHPIISAPMAVVSGGLLAAAVSTGGGLGLIGGGYGDREWLETQFRAAGNARVGCGFITWSLSRQPKLLDVALERKPAVVFLSFGDPASFADKIVSSGAILACQVQTIRDAKLALDCGAGIIVAQGAEAGGHGEARGTMVIVPEVADLLASRSPQTLLCAAGGVGDGRGLAASLMLGADGVVVGSRFLACTEALIHPNLQSAVINATGDDTIRTSVMDIARRLDWPERFTGRVLKNAFTRRWHCNEADLANNADHEGLRWRNAFAEGDNETATTFVGEATGLIHSVEPAAAIISKIASQAEMLLAEVQNGVIRRA